MYNKIGNFSLKKEVDNMNKIQVKELLFKIAEETAPVKHYCDKVSAASCKGCFWGFKDSWRDECVLDVIKDWVESK